jgi:hypothetical protein
MSIQKRKKMGEKGDVETGEDKTKAKEKKIRR